MQTCYRFIGPDSLDLYVRVQPGAKRQKVGGIRADGFLKVAVRAKAVDGQANKGVLMLLADTLHLKNRCLSILSGDKSRNKHIRISGESQLLNQVAQMLDQLSQPSDNEEL